MTGDPSIDVVVVGGGHNALACAAYLARAGMKVASDVPEGLPGHVTVLCGTQRVPATVSGSAFYDPTGSRLRGSAER